MHLYSLTKRYAVIKPFVYLYQDRQYEKSLMASNITILVEKAKQGDADALSTLYQMYYPKMKGICINILREDKAVVDDLVQDAFILAFVSLKELKNTHMFSQWLTSITTNLKSLLDISMLDIVRHHRQYL